MDDQILIQQLMKKDQAGLSQLYSKYSDAMYGIILRIVKNQSVAEEVMQSTFLTVWNKIDTYAPNRGSLFTWMYRIAKNKSIDVIRLKKFQAQEKTESFDVHVHSGATNKNVNSKIDVEKLMDGLDSKYKEVLNKMYLEGYSHGDIAKELDIPLGTVKTRLRTAIKKLRDELKDEKNLFIGLFLLLILLIIML